MNHQNPQNSDVNFQTTTSFELPEVIDLGNASELILGGCGDQWCDNTTDHGGDKTC